MKNLNLQINYKLELFDNKCSEKSTIYRGEYQNIQTELVYIIIYISHLLK